MELIKEYITDIHISNTDYETLTKELDALMLELDKLLKIE